MGKGFEINVFEDVTHFSPGPLQPFTSLSHQSVCKTNVCWSDWIPKNKSQQHVLWIIFLFTFKCYLTWTASEYGFCQTGSKNVLWIGFTTSMVFREKVQSYNCWHFPPPLKKWNTVIFFGGDTKYNHSDFLLQCFIQYTIPLFTIRNFCNFLHASITNSFHITCLSVSTLNRRLKHAKQISTKHFQHKLPDSQTFLFFANIETVFQMLTTHFFAHERSMAIKGTFISSGKLFINPHVKHSG